MRYKINITFSGTAMMELEAETPEAARVLASELELADLARAGHTDILTFKVAAREVTPAAALGGHADETADENAPRRPRPSGWYRPS